ncbi:MAG: hypothetical protein Q9222_004479 [Ikaeria aurantiellina]
MNEQQNVRSLASVTAENSQISSTRSSIDHQKKEFGSSPPDLGVIADARKIKGARWILVVIAILSSTFLYALDNTIVANIRPSIIGSLGQIEKLPWISVAYAAGEVGSNPFWGKIYTLFNAKWLYIISVTIFEIGSALCGAAPTTNALIVGRSIAGVGGSGIYVGTINILSSLTQTSERPLYLSFVGMAWSIGTVSGPIIGGALADSSASWRWAFYINLCVAAAAAPVFLLLLPSSPINSTLSSFQRLRKVDSVGVILFIGGMTTLIMAIDFGGAMFEWNSGQIIGLFITSAVLWILFSVQQSTCFLTTRSDRTFPIQYIASYEMCILFAQTSIAISCIIIPIYFIPLYFQFVHGDSALTAGVRMLPFIFAAVVGAMLNGALFAKVNIYMPWFIVAGILTTIGGGLLSTLSLSTNFARIYGFSVIVGIGAGIVVQAPYAVAQAKNRVEDTPSVTAFISCGQMAGVALSISIGTSVLLNQSTGKIAAILPDVPRATVQASIAGAGASFLDTVSEEQMTRVLAAVAETLGNIFYMVVAAGATAVVLAAFMKRERMLVPGTT